MTLFTETVKRNDEKWMLFFITAVVFCLVASAIVAIMFDLDAFGTAPRVVPTYHSGDIVSMRSDGSKAVVLDTNCTRTVVAKPRCLYWIRDSYHNEILVHDIEIEATK